ncbi:MAG: ABC transporter permease subunit [Armatimonadota bacterium]|nr:ABC transporter permease subunit [Armatimonadota bacterium]
MKSVWVIARLSILENSRKQVFHVLCLIMLAVIAGSTLLSIFTEGVKIKMLKDLCMTCILFAGAVLSIGLASTGIPNDIDSRVVYPILARPIARWHYVFGKFLGTAATVALAIAALSVVFCALIYCHQGHIDSFLATAALFAMLEAAVISAVAITLSTFTSTAVAALLSFMVYLFGTIKIGYLSKVLEKSPNSIAKTCGTVLYHVLPNLECFNLKAALVHGNSVPISYLLLVFSYGVCYTAFAVGAAALIFRGREV